MRLSAPGLNPVSVSYALSSITAISGLSCPRTTATGVPASPLMFATGETTQVVNVPIHDCPNSDPFETFKFTLSTPTNATIARATTLIGIVDNSTIATTPRVFVRDAVVDQKDGFVLVPVLLGGPSGQASASTVTVDYATSNGTATAGTDYTAVSGTLTFAPGQNVKNVEVPILDAGAKPTRTFTLNREQPDQRDDLRRHGHRRHRRQRRRSGGDSGRLRPAGRDRRRGRRLRRSRRAAVRARHGHGLGRLHDHGEHRATRDLSCDSDFVSTQPGR